VDTTAARCVVSVEEAPNLLTYNRDETAVHFVKQSEMPKESAAAHCAMFPIVAIANDG
jgi:hypothetical protein